MKKDQFISEVARRIGATDEAASLTLHAIISQIILGLIREGTVSAPKLGEWRMEKIDNKIETIFIPSPALQKLLSHTRSRQFEALEQSENSILEGGYVPKKFIEQTVELHQRSVDVVSVFKQVAKELGIDICFHQEIDRHDAERERREMSLSDSAEIEQRHEEIETIEAETSEDIPSVPELREDIHHDQSIALPWEQNSNARPTVEMTEADTASVESRNENIFSQEATQERHGNAYTTDGETTPDDALTPEPQYDAERFSSNYDQLYHPPKQKSSHLRTSAYIITVVLIGMGFYLAYTAEMLNHFLPTQYKYRRNSNAADVRQHEHRVTPDAGMKSTEKNHMTQPRYFLTVRIAPKKYDANAKLKQLELQGFYGGVQKSTMMIGRNTWYEVKLGPYSTRDSADLVSMRFKQVFGYPPTLDSLKRQ